jgi:hypothetical protein
MVNVWYILFYFNIFGLYFDALEGCLDNKECDAPALANVHVWLLLFADDFVLTLELEVRL